jgi:hypothetical protein
MLAYHDVMAQKIRVRSAFRILTFVVGVDNSLPPHLYALPIGFKADVVNGVAAVYKLHRRCVHGGVRLEVSCGHEHPLSAPVGLLLQA